MAAQGQIDFETCTSCPAPFRFDWACVFCTAALILTFPKPQRRDYIDYACGHKGHNPNDLKQEIIRQHLTKQAA